MSDVKASLQAADTISSILKTEGVDSVVIGAVALAAYHYIRFTEDIDLGVACDAAQLRKLAVVLVQHGYHSELHESDEFDSLSGVIDLTGPFGLVQIVNFGETIPAVIRDAIAEATLEVPSCKTLHFAPLGHLIALKLYAGGLQSKADIVELLRRNPETDLNEIRAVCRRYRLRGIDPILDEI